MLSTVIYTYYRGLVPRTSYRHNTKWLRSSLTAAAIDNLMHSSIQTLAVTTFDDFFFLFPFVVLVTFIRTSKLCRKPTYSHLSNVRFFTGWNLQKSPVAEVKLPALDEMG